MAEIPGSELTLARRRGAARTSIDFIGEIKDEYGVTIQNIRDSIAIRLSDADAEQLTRRPIQSVVLSSQRVPIGDELFTVKQDVELAALNCDAGVYTSLRSTPAA